MPILRGMRSFAKYVWMFVFVAFVGGFLLLDTSGLLGSNAISPTTAVATVDGTKILYVDWQRRVQNASQQQRELYGRTLNRDELKALEDRVLEEMILDILLREEYKRRGISVTADEIRRAALYMPHPDLMRQPDLLTDGEFDLEKYRRLIQSPSAAQLRLGLEDYYRAEIPRLKLFQQVAADVYISDAEMWAKWQQTHDSVGISYVDFVPEMLRDTSATSVSEAEIRSYYDEHKKSFERIGSATVSVLHIPIVVTAADTSAAHEKVAALRAEIVDGAGFEDVAERESDDTATASIGGSLGRGVRGRFADEFEQAAYALRVGQLSQPILSPFGYHLIRVDERKGDTLSLRHILVEIRQRDSAALATARRADTLAAIAASSENPADFDSAASRLGLTPKRATIVDGQPLILEGRYVPSVAGWAFSEARAGETSEVFDAPDGYYLARVDELVESGVQSLSEVRDAIRDKLKRRKQIEQLMPQARDFAARALATSLQAAAAESGRTVSQTPMFTRFSFVQGLGRANEVIGAAFALATGALSAPVSTEDAIFVFRVDRRVNADPQAWELQRDAQRQILAQSLQEERVQLFLRGLREQADVKDLRRQVAQLGRG